MFLPRKSIALCIVILMASPQAFAQNQSDMPRCRGESGATAEQRIESCTKAILSPNTVGLEVGEAFTNLGKAYASRGQLDLAIESYILAAMVQPRLASLFAARGEIYAANGNLEKANKDFNRAIKLDPNLIRAKEAKARLSPENNPGVESNGLAKDSEQFMGILELTALCNNRQANESDEIANDIDRILKKIPPEHAYGRLCEFGKTVNIPFREKVATRTLLNNNVCSDPIEKMVSLFSLGNYRQTVKVVSNDCKKAKMSAPEPAASEQDWNNCTQAKNIAFKQKIKSCMSVVEAPREHPLGRAIAYEELCHENSKVGLLTQALSYCEKSLSIRPDDAYTLTVRGFIYLKSGEFDKAIDDFETALEADARGSSAVKLYGIGLAKIKKGDESGKIDIEKATKLKADVAERASKSYGYKQ